MQLTDFKDLHKGKECVILTCGPSLIEYSKDSVKKFLQDKVVICVKESIIEFNDEADYFFFNFWRDRTFDINPKVIKIFQSNNKDEPKNKPDFILYEDRPFNFTSQLLNIKNFDKYNLVNNSKRPWGPGILYESVFYFCLYAGFKNVYTIGWDLIDTNKTHRITHYFDDSNSNKYKNSVLCHDTNYKKEMQLVNNNIPYLYDYLKEKGMNIFVIGKKSFVNKHIPRKYL